MPLPKPLSKLSLLTLWCGALVLVMGLARWLFFRYFGEAGGPSDAAAFKAFYLGLKFDARWAAIQVAPAWLLMTSRTDLPARRAGLAAAGLAALLAVYAGLVAVAMVDDRAARPWLAAFLLGALVHRLVFPSGGFHAPAVRWAWRAYFAFSLGFTLLAYAVDFGAYAYIHTRLNGTLLMFLDNPALSARMVWESYPVVWGILGLLFLLGVALWGWERAFRRLAPPPRGWTRVAGGITGSVLLLGLMYGKWSRYPLRWGEAFEARNSFYAQAALNPALFFLETRQDMDGGFDLAQVRATHAALAEYFGIPAALDAEGLPTLRRRIEPRASVGGRPNVVFIQLESLAAFKTSPFGNPLNPTPYLDRLCREGLLFDRFNVVMENTSRSMFATLFGIGDVSSTQNATRNPLLVDQHTILSQYPDYEKAYFLGGSANWAQIRAALKNNIKEMELFEEGAFTSPVVDVWGISDVDLLQEANAQLRTRRKPFWAYVQTSGNHPPFTIPRHHTGFRTEAPAEDQLHRGGFVSREEYNAVRLMDYALERYFEAARKEPYFQNTIFVLWGDHGIPRGSLDARFGDLTLAIHQVPFLIYAPGKVAPGRIHTVASQLDILPTVASLLDRPVWTQTLGKDLFDPAYAERSAAFTFTTFRRPPRIGLLQGDFYLNVETDGRPRLFRTGEPDPKDLAESRKDEAARMLHLVQGFHAWSRFLLSHNRPFKAPGP